MLPRASRPSPRLVVVALLCVSSLALAALSPLLIGIALSGAGLSIGTYTMPKGWFASGNTFDRTKSELRTEVALGATGCSTAFAPLTVSSADAGTFSPVLAGGANPVGWTWTTGVDLSSYQNHWWNYVRCDATIDVLGCSAAIPVTVTTTAYARSGTCHQYVDDAGTTLCASDSRSASLPSVQDADVYELCPLDVCGIGQCQSACQEECNSYTYGGAIWEQHDARRACHTACECLCLREVREGTSCNLPAKCALTR